MQILTPIELTLRSEKGSPLTHEEMDNNLRLFKILADNRPEIKAAAVFKPEHITISGTTNITSDMVEGSETLQTYLQNPLTITVNSFFEPSVVDTLEVRLQPSGQQLATIQPSQSDTFQLMELSELHIAFEEVADTAPIVFSFHLLWIEMFRAQVGTYTKVSSGE